MKNKTRTYLVREVGYGLTSIVADGVAIKDGAAVFYKRIMIRGGQGKYRIDVVAMFPLSAISSIMRNDI